MSLFENPAYTWRETYFLFFPEARRPSASALAEALGRLGPQFELREVQGDEQGGFESLTLVAHEDSAAMDITYVSGEEVRQQVRDIQRDLKSASLSKAEQLQLKRLGACDARLDLYHFEELEPRADEGPEERLDPGALLLVVQQLAKLCHGVGVDPQSGSFL